jgi:hypothetical protein
MGQPLRMYEPNRVYEITVRTIQGRRLLRPSPDVNDLIAGIIGRAQRLYPAIELYGVVVLSNHCTWLLSSSIPEQIPAFMGYINGNISREIGRIHDWPGKLWERPQRPIPILDDESLIARFEYLLAQGCKEELVASPLQWPGVTCVFALLGKRELRGTWYDRDLATKAHRRGLAVSQDAFATRYSVRFEKLPCWEHLSDEQYTARVEGVVKKIIREGHKRRGHTGKHVMGADAVCRVHPHHRPDSLTKSPAPPCHTTSDETKRLFRKRYRAFVEAFKAAAYELAQGLWPVQFPLYCFPPSLPFVTCEPDITSTA